MLVTLALMCCSIDTNLFNISLLYFNDAVFNINDIELYYVQAGQGLAYLFNILYFYVD